MERATQGVVGLAGAGFSWVFPPPSTWGSFAAAFDWGVVEFLGSSSTVLPASIVSCPCWVFLGFASCGGSAVWVVETDHI